MTQWWHRPKTSLGYPLLQLRCKRTVKGIPMAKARDGPGPKLGLPSLVCLFSRLAGQVRVQLAELWHEFSCTPSPCPHASYIGFLSPETGHKWQTWEFAQIKSLPSEGMECSGGQRPRQAYTQTELHVTTAHTLCPGFISCILIDMIPELEFLGHM